MAGAMILRRVSRTKVQELDDLALREEFDYWQKKLGPPSKLIAGMNRRRAVVREFIWREYQKAVPK